MKRGKKYTETAKLIDRAAQYDTEEGFAMNSKAVGGIPANTTNLGGAERWQRK